MNWCDFAVIAIILGFGVFGLINGFIFSIFRIASFFASIIISIKLYPRVSAFLMQTAVYTKIKASILKNILLQKQSLPAETAGAGGQGTADAVVGKLPLPGFLKNFLLDKVDSSKLADTAAIMDSISSELAKIAIDVLSLIVLYILIRIALIFVKVILQGIAKLPVFKQIDKLGGFALGAVEGLLTVYILCAILMLFSSSPQFAGIFSDVNESALANYIYQNNFITDWMLTGYS